MSGGTVLYPASSITHSYTPNGSRARVVQSGAVTRTVRYAYDVQGKLRVKDCPEGTITCACAGFDHRMVQCNCERSVHGTGLARFTAPGIEHTPPPSSSPYSARGPFPIGVHPCLSLIPICEFWESVLSRNPDFTAGLLKVVAGGGIEPPTQGFSVLCSTN